MDHLAANSGANATPKLAYYLPRVIGLSGPAGAGKDTAADYLCEQHGYTRLSFADPIKSMVRALLATSGHHGVDPFDRSAKDEPWPALVGLLDPDGKAISPRTLAQTLGTEWGRGALNPGLWVRLMRARISAIQESFPDARVVIPDVRFPNEAGFIRRLDGALWAVARRSAVPVRAHVSETALADALMQPDAILFNDFDIPALHAGIDTLLLDPSRRAA